MVFGENIKSTHLALTSSGGAAIAAKRYVEMENMHGNESEFIFKVKKLSIAGSVVHPFLHVKALIDTFLFRDDTKILFSHFRSKMLINTIRFNVPGNVNIHWAPGIVSTKDFNFFLNNFDKIYIHLHDLWFSTGGCHMPIDCNEHRNGCNSCPIAPNILRSSIRSSFNNKLSFLDNKKVKILAPSPWIKNYFIKNISSNIDIHVLYNPINTSNYFKFSKSLAKKLLNIQVDSFVIGFVSNNINQPSKGVRDCISFLEDLLAKNILPKNLFLIIVGRGKINTSIPYKQFHHSEDLNLTSLTFSAMDLFINPSKVESFSYTNIEAGLHGTPVFCFSNGGSEVTVKDSITGYTFNNFKFLKKLLIQLFNGDIDLNSISKTARDYVITNFDSKVIYDQYQNLP